MAPTGRNGEAKLRELQHLGFIISLPASRLLF
jgi:hypothetical protein